MTNSVVKHRETMSWESFEYVILGQGEGEEVIPNHIVRRLYLQTKGKVLYILNLHHQ